MWSQDIRKLFLECPKQLQFRNLDMEGDQDTAWHLNVWDSAACAVLHSSVHDSVAAAWDALIGPCHACCAAKFVRSIFNDDLSAYDKSLSGGMMPEYEGPLASVRHFDWQAAVRRADALAPPKQARETHSSGNTANDKGTAAGADLASCDDSTQDLPAQLQQSVVVSEGCSSAANGKPKHKSKGSKSRRKKSKVDTSELD